MAIQWSPSLCIQVFSLSSSSDPCTVQFNPTPSQGLSEEVSSDPEEILSHTDHL